MEKAKKHNQQVDAKEFQQLQQKRNELINYLERIKGVKRNQKENYTKHINFLLERAEIICTTLASSGSEKLDRFKGMIDVLIIDEAAQVHLDLIEVH
jgi:senataxin